MYIPPKMNNHRFADAVHKHFSTDFVDAYIRAWDERCTYLKLKLYNNTPAYKEHVHFHSNFIFHEDENQHLLNVNHDFMYDYIYNIVSKYCTIMKGESFPFDTGGFSGSFILGESHFNWHSYPESNLLTLDLYHCKYDEKFSPINTSLLDVCEQASPQCKAMCLYTAGRGVFTNVQQARINRTKLFFEKNKEFLELLFKEITIFEAYCKEHEVQGNIRLNGTSDLDFIIFYNKINKDIFQLFPELNFYDYTKDYSRETSYENYYLLYSRTEETSIETVKSLVEADKNVAVVFDEVPEEWHNIKVINGDINDLRLNDESGVIVGLKAKGKAKRSKREIVSNDRSFVINTIDLH